MINLILLYTMNTGAATGYVNYFDFAYVGILKYAGSRAAALTGLLLVPTSANFVLHANG